MNQRNHFTETKQDKNLLDALINVFDLFYDIMLTYSFMIYSFPRNS